MLHLLLTPCQHKVLKKILLEIIKEFPFLELKIDHLPVAGLPLILNAIQKFFLQQRKNSSAHDLSPVGNLKTHLNTSNGGMVKYSDYPHIKNCAISVDTLY